MSLMGITLNSTKHNVAHTAPKKNLESTSLSKRISNCFKSFLQKLQQKYASYACKGERIYPDATLSQAKPAQPPKTQMDFFYESIGRSTKNFSHAIETAHKETAAEDAFEATVRQGIRKGPSRIQNPLVRWEIAQLFS